MTETKKKTTKKTEEKKPLIAPNTVITLTIPAKVAEAAYDKALNKLAKKVKTSGFRKGKVPAKVAEEHLEPQQVIEEALQTVVPQLYTTEIKKQDLKPLTYPEFRPVSLEKGKDWIMEAHIAQRPEVKLKGYEKTIKTAQKGAVKELANQLKASKEAAEKHEHKEGEKHDHTHDHKEPTEMEKRNFTLQYIYKNLVESIKPEIQELLVKEEVKYDLDNLNHRLKQMNIPFEKFLEHRGMTFEQLSNELAAGALGRLQISFIVDEISKSEKLTVEKADLDAEFENITDPKLKKQQETDPIYIDMMSQTIIRQKVADHILKIK